MSPVPHRLAAALLAAALLLTGNAAAHAEPLENPSPALPEDATIVVDALPPSFGPDAEVGFYSIPQVDGVEYLLYDEHNAGTVIDPRTALHRLGNGYTTITARALPGYGLRADASWGYAMANNPGPGFWDSMGTEDDYIHIEDNYLGPYFTYSINGTVVAPGDHPARGTVTVEAIPLRTGFTMVGPSRWTHTFRSDVRASVSAAPTFDIARSSYTIRANAGVLFLVNGSVRAPGTYRANGPITITSQGLPGYIVLEERWSYDFTQYFVDVRVGIPLYEHMVWMEDQGISLGWRTPRGNEYRPLEPTKRDAVAAFLYRMAGSPKVKLPARSPFTDVPATHPHYRAVVWAYQEGITTGWRMKDGTRQFRPAAATGRDAMAAFLYRFAGEPAYTMPRGTCFKDVPRTREFAEEICWMKATGLSTGWSDGTYRPSDPVRRDAMAAFLHRYAETF